MNKCDLTLGRNQIFILTERGEIVVDSKCVTADYPNVPLRSTLCNSAFSEDAKIAHKFIYNEDVSFNYN